VANEKVQLVPETSVVSLQIYIISSKDPNMKRAVEVGLFECPGCDGTLGIDQSYIEQVTESVACPYCRDLIMITEVD
jgi:hypothetical protein